MFGRIYDTVYQRSAWAFIFFYLLWIAVSPFLDRFSRLEGTLSVCLLAFTSYVTIVMYINKDLTDTKQRAPLIVAAFPLTFALICIPLSAPVAAYSLVDFGNVDDDRKRFMSLYYTIVTFTTTGYGDLKPTSLVGQFYASFVAVFGVTHAVTFVGFFSAAIRDKKPAIDAK